MPRPIPQHELDHIIDIVSGFDPDGASLDQIHSCVRPAMPRRTLQRRLATLVAHDQLVTAGAGRGSRYYTPGHAPAADAGTPLSRQRALAILTELKPRLADRFGITRLALFGSTVRNEAGPDSDIDIMVEFDGPATSRRYFGLQFLLEDKLGHAVDLVTSKALRPELAPYIEREAIDV